MGECNFIWLGNLEGNYFFNLFFGFKGTKMPVPIKQIRGVRIFGLGVRIFGLGSVVFEVKFQILNTILKLNQH